MSETPVSVKKHACVRGTASLGKEETRALSLYKQEPLLEEPDCTTYVGKLWKALAYKSTRLFPVTMVKMELLEGIFPSGCVSSSLDCTEDVSNRSGAAQVLVSGQNTSNTVNMN